MEHKKFKIDNAVILAAGFSSRFAPLSLHTPKALLKVKGEILIERQIRQLQEAGIRDIYVVTGYLGQQFDYLRERAGVSLIENKEYQVRNNHSPGMSWPTLTSAVLTIILRKISSPTPQSVHTIPRCMPTDPQRNTV